MPIDLRAAWSLIMRSRVATASWVAGSRPSAALLPRHLVLPRRLQVAKEGILDGRRVDPGLVEAQARRSASADSEFTMPCADASEAASAASVRAIKMPKAAPSAGRAAPRWSKHRLVLRSV